MSTTTLFLIVVIGLAIGGALTVPSLRATKYMGLAGASVTLIGAAIGLVSGSQQAVFVGGIVAMVSGFVGICIGLLVGRLRDKHPRND